MYVVYALYNKESNKIYIGQTKDLETRLKMHNEKTFKGFTSRFSGLWTLIYSEEYSTREEVLIREKQLKSYQGRVFIKTHIPA